MFLTFLAWRRGPQIDLGSYGEPRRAYVVYAQNMTIGKLTMQQLHILHCTFRFYKYTNKYQLFALKYALLRHRRRLWGGSPGTRPPIIRMGGKTPFLPPPNNQTR